MLYELLNIGLSLAKGFALGGSVYALGWLLDNTISLKSQKELRKTKEEEYLQGQQYIFDNLVLISPIIYAGVDLCFLTHEPYIQFGNYMSLMLIQNLGYFFAHKEMHRNKKLYWIHKFHHKFDTIVTPSTGNAVSKIEFIVAYVCPIVFGGYILKPTELTFLSAIGTISIFNLIIHTQELNHVWWVPGMVSPTNHIDHHRVRDKHYAAPLVNIDDFILVSDSMWKQYKN